MGNKIKELLTGITPSKIAGEATGALVGKVMEGLDSVFTSKEEKLAAEQKITEEINRHNEAIINATLEETKAVLADVADSREMNAKIQESEKASWFAKNTAYFLDIFLGLIWGTVTIILILKALKLADNINADLTALLSIYSTVTAIFMISINFHRGSSVGSKAANDVIRKIADKK